MSGLMRVDGGTHNEPADKGDRDVFTPGVGKSRARRKGGLECLGVYERGRGDAAG